MTVQRRVPFGIALMLLMFYGDGFIEAQHATPPARPEGLQIKLQTYLAKDPAVADYIQIDSSGIAMFAGKTEKKKGRVECHLTFEEIPLFQQMVRSLPVEEALKLYQKKKTGDFPKKLRTALPDLPEPYRPQASNYPRLPGLKVAIDPGHMAGDMAMAMIEDRYLKIDPAALVNSAPVEFHESALTLATALILQDFLKKAGAEVFLTRTVPGQSAFGKTFQEWQTQDFAKTVKEAVAQKDLTKQQADHLLKKADEFTIFQTFFRQLELEERARRINAFHPDLTVIMHYNADSNNERSEAKTYVPSLANYNMAFVAGAFSPDDLKKPVDRMLFLYLLVSDGIEQSLRFSHYVLKHLTDTLQVPVAERSEDYVYLSGDSLPTGEKGLYARNLRLSRFVYGTLCYGETLFQDHFLESQRLADTSFQYGDLHTSHRVYQVAQAYYDAIVNYVYSPDYPTATPTTAIPPLQISATDAQQIGQQIGRNETGGNPDAFITWNEGEQFLSAGIGHFIWYPPDVPHAFEESFPKLLRFFQESGYTVPDWLQKSPACPWKSRAEFQKQRNSPKSKELESLLTATIPLQAQFLAQRLERALPQLLLALPPEDPARSQVQMQFYRVAQSPGGLYALMDYVNFKGEGVSLTERYQGQGWGLLQVLLAMPAEAQTPVNAFADAAEAMLTHRVQNAPPERHEERWLEGWKNRIATYRQGHTTNTP